MTTMTKYSDMLKKAESLSDKLSKAKGTMYPSQLKRYIEIQTKVTSAITTAII